MNADPPAPQDPHDVESRKWFRRIMITLCVLGFTVILLPDGFLDGRFTRSSVRHPPPVKELSYECRAVTVGGSRVVDSKVVDIKALPARPDRVTWYECTKRFSDGSWFTRLGDVKP